MGCHQTNIIPSAKQSGESENKTTERGAERCHILLNLRGSFQRPVRNDPSDTDLVRITGHATGALRRVKVEVRLVVSWKVYAKVILQSVQAMKKSALRLGNSRALRPQRLPSPRIATNPAGRQFGFERSHKPWKLHHRSSINSQNTCRQYLI
jgi:hypothetical protein